MKAVNQGYQPANETKAELERYLPANIDNTTQRATKNETKSKEYNADPDSNFSAQLGLVFIDFNLISDTLMEVTDEQLIDDLNHESNKKLADTLGIKTKDKQFIHLTEDKINLLKQYADTGNPEALTILGRIYEQGIFFDKSLLKAAKYYIMASQLDYFRAKALLLKILSQSFMDSLITDVQSAQNDDAMFVIYGLWSLGLYNHISESQAESFLKKAASHNHIESIIELANGYYTRKLSNGSEGLAIKIWKQAADNGNFQAKIRLAAANILSGENIEDLSTSTKTIKQAVDFGSILAQISLAYCHEKGIGVTKSKSEAVKFYRLAAQRGNSLAYDELKRIYDEIRPKEKRFEIN
jgi:TPR repeat protein